MGIKIIKNAPPPPTPRKNQYPFFEMEIGDAFDVPDEMRDRIRSAAAWYGNKHGKTFTVRVVANGKLRCWRVA